MIVFQAVLDVMLMSAGRTLKTTEKPMAHGRLSVDIENTPHPPGVNASVRILSQVTLYSHMAKAVN